MLHLPDPVHPFAVHFPVAFLLLGTVAVVSSLLWPNRYIVRLALLCMLLGALGGTWAHRTGAEEAAAIRYVGESTALAVQEHKNASDLMLAASWIAAVAAAVVFFSNLIPGVSLLARLVAVAACLFMLWTLQAAHHTGMVLTHEHFFGPNAPKPLPGTEQVIRLKVQ
ncbi:MAG: hypothetical protein FGM15_07975 [Chthoniobacterales bacterium]|nr:hypothetical protein [Chthoniobacterales bacterium]